MRNNILVKLSGDTIDLTDEQVTWLKVLSVKSHVVIVVGGGTQINDAFKKAGYEVKPFGPMGREHASFEERQLARNVLEKNQAELQDRLLGLDMHLTVEIPVVQIGSVLCHVNGDDFAKYAYNGFDKIYIVTKAGARADMKKEIFQNLPKVSIKTFETL